ncbi:hypothetical protein H0W26_02525 [Candidatus Dependentiae bacterium]|nr:hypothetical protein [Candidatus Dependentiae bacterium]
MVKKMLFACMLVTPVAVYAEWIDDIVASYDRSGAFDRVQALSILEGYREKEDKKRRDLETTAKHSDTSGFWGTIRGGGYKAQVALARSQEDYYKKVARSIIQFPETKRKKESFTYALRRLSRYKKGLDELRTQYSASSSSFDKVKLGTLIAAKETQLATYKAYVKNILI